MFTIVKGNTGRYVYVGEVTRSNETAFEIRGEEYNTNERQMIERTIQVNIDAEIQPQNNNIKPGEILITTVLPSRKNPNLGTAEEIARNQQAILIQNENNNEKVVIIGQVKNKRWNDKHSLLSVSFYNIQDTEGNFIGYNKPFTDRFGEQRDAYWLNVTLFNATKNGDSRNLGLADIFDNNVEKGDKVVLISTKKISEYQGKEYTNYNGSKFVVIEKSQSNLSQNSQSNNESEAGKQTQQPNNTSPDTKVQEQHSQKQESSVNNGVQSQDKQTNKTQLIPDTQPNQSQEKQSVTQSIQHQNANGNRIAVQIGGGMFDGSFGFSDEEELDFE